MKRHASPSPSKTDTEYFSEADVDAVHSKKLLKSPDDDIDDSDRAWYEFDFSVLLALLSPVFNWLTGGDHVKNVLLLILIVFYLHQIIEVPWRLYLASRPRCALHPLPQDRTSPEARYNRVALSELRTLEFFYLTLSVLSPFIGATLLRTVVISFSGPSTVSWFSQSLFVLATGMRPWKHAIQRLRQRTTDLHTTIHYPPSEIQKMDTLIERVAQLETELLSLRKHSDSSNSDVYEHVDDAVEMLEIAARRQEKKQEVSKAFIESRLTKLEQGVEAILEQMEIRADTPALYRIMSQMATLVSASMDRLSPFLPSWIVARCRGNISRSPRSSPKITRSRTAIKLETIPEVATFQPKSSVQPSRYLYVPGFGLVSRICHLAALPLHWVITFFLARQTYTFHTRPSLS